MSTLWTLLSYPFRRQPRRPLAQRQPHANSDAGKPELGMEATDRSIVDKVTRKNDALERVNLPNASGIDTAQRATHVQKMPDDEKYAKRFHAAFNKKGS